MTTTRFFRYELETLLPNRFFLMSAVFRMFRNMSLVFFFFLLATVANAWSGSVTLKLAVDLSGGVDDLSGEAHRFTSGKSLDAAHRLRRMSDAVLVGVNTVVRDDPSLTVRRVPFEKQPLRVVVDPRKRTPATAKLRTDGERSIFFVNDPSEPFEEPCGSIASMLDILETKYGVSHVMVEGGPATARNFLNDCLVDRAVIVRAPIRFSDPVPSHITPRLLRHAGLTFLGKHRWDHDDVSMWGRKGLDTIWDRLELDSPSYEAV